MRYYCITFWTDGPLRGEASSEVAKRQLQVTWTLEFPGEVTQLADIHLKRNNLEKK